jgi:hypothetical protein
MKAQPLRVVKVTVTHESAGMLCCCGWSWEGRSLAAKAKAWRRHQRVCRAALGR